MANEFKIKKGLIVEGASGGAVVDIQGSQGQLFSVTDDLSGSIFAVSDISGVPILDVNSSGVSYFDGKVGIGNVAPPVDLYVGSVLTGTYGDGTFTTDAIVTNDTKSITIGANKRAGWAMNATTSTSTTFQSKLNIWTGNEDHITFGGSSTGIVTAWEEFKLWINNDSANAGTLHLYHTDTKTEFARFAGGGNSWLNGGNVGIGATNPPQKLAVIGNISLGNYNGSDFSRSIGINDASGAYGNGSSYIKFNELSGSGTSGTTKGAAIEFYNHLYAGNTNQTVIIQANGNVGIGTTSPGAQLEVMKDGGAIIRLHDPGNNSWKLKADTDFHIYDDSNSNYFKIANLGNITFGAYGAGTLVTDASGNITAATSGAGTGTVTGGGSAGRVAYWTNANNITSNAGFTFNNSDLEIPRYLKHDGETNTYIGFENNATPVIFAGGWQLFGNDNLKFAALYGDGGIKLKTTLTGISVTGEGLFTGDVGIGTAINGYQLSLGSSGSGSIFAFGKIFTTGNIQSSTGNITSLKVGATTAANSNVKLDIDGRVLIRDSDGVADLYLGNYAADKHFRFHTDNSTTYFDMNCGTIRWREGSSTRFYFYPSTANMTINGTLTQNSDSRVKENIVEIDNCISKVQAMRGVYYNRTDYNTEATKVGVIAQEVEAVLPELILESPDDGLKSVAYAELTAVLINAIKEQQEIIEDLKTRIEQLEN